MSEIRCTRCGKGFDGRSVACCPACLAQRWLETPNLVRPKHDPSAATSRLDTYRSLVTPRLKTDLREVLQDAAARGRWFRDMDYGMWVHVTVRPLGRAPGVGVLAGRTEPDHALDCLFIAEADSAVEAHVFAADGARHEAQVRAGVFEPLGGCDTPGCENFRAPGHPDCDAHQASRAGDH